VSETTGADKSGQGDQEREDPSIAGRPEVPAGSVPDTPELGRLEEREQRQQTVQQHGDTFDVDSEQPTDTSGIEQQSSNRETAPPAPERDDS
jgi:hypothetical protein